MARLKPYIFPIVMMSAMALMLAVDAMRPREDIKNPGASEQDVMQRAWAFYERRPSFERPRPPSAIPAGLTNVRAETCGGCHVEIYEEWSLSTHRRAFFDDAQFMEELAKSRGEKDASAGDVGWLCVNCHTPDMRQQPQLVVGLRDGVIAQPVYMDNPDFDEVMQAEAISCATCHVRDGVVYGPYGDTDAPHATRKGEQLLTATLCTSCHQAEATYPTQNLGCFFSTGREWQASAYAERGQTCQSCHMPEVERALVPGGKPRRTRRHWFGGSLIPKKPEYAEQLKPLEAIYGDGVTFEVELASGQPEATPAPPDFEHAPRVFGCEPAVQACQAVRVRVTNSRAGHAMPTGDPERHIEVLASVRTAGGELVAQGYDLLGTRYAWWPEIKLLHDTRIPVGGSREVVLWVPAAAGELTLQLTAHKQRMYPGAFELHELEGRSVRGRLFHDSRWKVKEGRVQRAD